MILKRCVTASLLAVSIGVGLAAETDSARKAREFMKHGRYDKAEKLLEDSKADDPKEIRLRLELAIRKGQAEKADTLARHLMSRYRTGLLSTADQLAQAAFGAWQLDQWQQANDIYIEISELSPAPASMLIDWGTLYLEKYNAAEAQEIFSEALGASPTEKERSAALSGLAQALREASSPGSEQALQQALEIDPENLHAMTLSVSSAVTAENWEQAEEWLEKGLKLNKKYLPLLEQRTAMHYFRGETSKFEKSRKEVLKINPRNGDLYEVLGHTAVSKRRMEEAEDFFRESVRLNPRQWSAWASLGVNLLRLAREEEGKQILERAYANDPFNIWTVNTLRLLDSYVDFEEFRTEHFIVRLEKEESQALRPAVEELLERSLGHLEEKYSHQVTGTYVFEMFRDHEDFAVRTLGMPGLGALGATFGRVVAMDSPSARKKGEFHWGSTLWHEVAHVITLSLSDQKVPRWLTEGLSMMEERLGGLGWGEYLTPTFVDAYSQGELLPLKDLNDGFQRPKSGLQIQLSYYQAGWLCEFLASRYGFGKIREMLLAYAEDKTTAQVFETVLGASMEEVDKEFTLIVDETLKPLVEKLSVQESAEGQAGLAGLTTVEHLQMALAQSPDNYFLNLKMGRKLFEEERYDEAVPYLEAALEVLPSYAGSGSPYQLLAGIHEKGGDSDKRIEILTKWWQASPKLSDVAIDLAGLLESRGDGEKAMTFLEESMYADPLRIDAHLDLGRLYLDQDRPEDAIRELEIVLGMKPNDVAGARFQLARAFHAVGNAGAAKEQVLLSLEIAPSYRDAQRLLLELVKP